mgnify:CR=1 FL=1
MIVFEKDNTGWNVHLEDSYVVIQFEKGGWKDRVDVGYLKTLDNGKYVFQPKEGATLTTWDLEVIQGTLSQLNDPLERL